jgi:DNA-binding response OmpR family regulator
MALIIDGTPVKLDGRKGCRRPDRFLVILDQREYYLTLTEFRYLETLANRKLKYPESSGWVSLTELDRDFHNAHNHIYRLRKHIPLKIISGGAKRYCLDYPAEGIEIRNK